MTPVVELMPRPAGRPEALKFRPEAPTVLSAVRGSNTASPSASACGPGLARATRGVTVHTNDWLTLLDPSVAVTVT